VDGTLVVSNDAHARAWVEAFAEHGVRVDYEQVRRRIGMGGEPSRHRYHHLALRRLG
jgi:beta-phosphoglucomutase-like phosphatase (HAD superfamily)